MAVMASKFDCRNILYCMHDPVLFRSVTAVRSDTIELKITYYSGKEITVIISF